MNPFLYHKSKLCIEIYCYNNPHLLTTNVGVVVLNSKNPSRKHGEVAEITTMLSFVIFFIMLGQAQNWVSTCVQLMQLTNIFLCLVHAFLILQCKMLDSHWIVQIGNLYIIFNTVQQITTNVTFSNRNIIKQV